jgi:hypothetical protein
MKRIVFFALMVIGALSLTACGGILGGNGTTDPTATPSTDKCLAGFSVEGITGVPNPEMSAGQQVTTSFNGGSYTLLCNASSRKVSATLIGGTATPIPTATPMPTATAMPTLGATTLDACHDNSTTRLGARDPLKVNDALTNIEVRDQTCVRDLYHTETGVAKGGNYRLDVPTGWTVALAAVSCQVAKDGTQPVDYVGGPFLVIRGPWHGSVGCYEAGIHGVPQEWESYLLTTILQVHRDEVGNANLQPIFLR